MDAAEHIEEGLPIPAHLEAIFVDGTALGGARPKASVRDEQGVLWLAKFSSRKDGFDIPTIECAALRLGAAVGLTVPPVEVRSMGKRRVLLILMSVQDDLNYGKLWDSIFPECYPWQDHVELIWSW